MLEAPSGGGGVGWTLMALLVIALVIGGLLLAQPISRDATERAQAASAATQAAERERTERERLNQETQQQQAALRAEHDARSMGLIGVIAALGAVALGGLALLAFMIFGMSWAEGRQLQRTLLLLEAQRAARGALPTAQPDCLLLAPVRRTAEDVERGRVL